MPVKKMSVSVSQEMLGEIEKRGVTVSGAIGTALERYFALLERALTELRSQLNEDECALILDATNATTFSNSPASIALMWAGVDDAIALDGLAQKWQVDGPALVAKIRASGMVGQAALVDASERWWGRVAAGEQPAYAELLATSAPAQ